MSASNRHLAGAFAAMVFVGASWGANLPVTKVILVHLDLLPMAAVRIAIGTITVGVLLWLVEGRAALRIAVGLGRFLALGLMMASFFVMYSLGIHYSNPITASAVQVAGPLVAAATVWAATGQRFDPGFGTALALTVVGGAILAAGSLLDKAQATFGGGEIVVLGSNILWTLYSLKAQAWFATDSQLHRTYVASLSATGWLFVVATAVLWLGWARSPFGAGDAWIWAQLVIVAVLASGLGGYFWNVGASRLGVAVASLWVNLVPFFAVLFSMAYGFQPNIYQVAGGLVALSGVVYMQMRKLRTVQPSA